MDYLIYPVSLAEPSDSNCRVVRGADNVQLYVGSRAACERFVDRCHQFNGESEQQDVQTDASIALSVARQLRALGIHPLDFHLVVKDGAVTLTSYNLDAAQKIEKHAPLIQERIPNAFVFEHTIAFSRRVTGTA